MNPIQKNLIKELKLEHLSEKEAEKRLENVGLIIYQNVLMHVMDMLTDEEQDQFEKLLDENAHPNEIFMFLNKMSADLTTLLLHIYHILQALAPTICGYVVIFDILYNKMLSL